MYHRPPNPSLPAPRSFANNWENALVKGLTTKVDSIAELSSEEVVNLARVLLEMRDDGRDYADRPKHPAYVNNKTTRQVHRDLLLRIIMGGVSLRYFFSSLLTIL